jgi:hypothetical protein
MFSGTESFMRAYPLVGMGAKIENDLFP